MMQEGKRATDPPGQNEQEVSQGANAYLNNTSHLSFMALLHFYLQDLILKKNTVTFYAKSTEYWCFCFF